jgi:tetratricopeptide (TPR) repeat protein
MIAHTFRSFRAKNEEERMKRYGGGAALANPLRRSNVHHECSDEFHMYDDENENEDQSLLYRISGNHAFDLMPLDGFVDNDDRDVSLMGGDLLLDGPTSLNGINVEYLNRNNLIQSSDTHPNDERNRLLSDEQLRSKLWKFQVGTVDPEMNSRMETLREELLHVVNRFHGSAVDREQSDLKTTTNIDPEISSISLESTRLKCNDTKNISNSVNSFGLSLLDGKVVVDEPTESTDSIDSYSPEPIKEVNKNVLCEITGKDHDSPLTTSKPSNVRRRRYSALQTLPTLDETTDKISLPTPSKSLDSKVLLTSETNTHLVDSHSTNANNVATKTIPSNQKKSRVSKIKELQLAASDLAQRGAEEESMKTYRKALNIASAEMSRIKIQIEKSNRSTFKSRYSENTSCPLPVAAIRSIQKRIQEDLLAISDRFGKIRIIMTVLHERMGEYEKAIESCTETIDVYKHQQILYDESDSDTKTGLTAKNGQNQKTPVDRLRDAKKIMHRLELGRSMFDQRQHTYDEMNEIRQRLSETSDTTEKEKLLVLLHGVGWKLLRRETKALGKSHPQIVDPLYLMATLSQEIGKRDEASLHLVNAFKVLRANYGMKHPKTAEVCIKIAKFHRSIHDQMSCNSNTTVQLSAHPLKYHEEISMEYFMYATEILRASCLRPTLLGATLNDAAIIYMKRLDYNKAIELLTEALQRYEESSESLTTAIATDLAARSENSANAEHNDVNSSDEEGEKCTSSSTSSTISASTYSENIGATSRHNANLSIDTLQVWRNLGDAYFQVQRYDEAKDSFANALEIQRSTRMIHDAVSELDLGIVGVEAGMMRLVDDASIVDTLSRLGRACASAGKHDEALKSHKESLELMNRIAIDEELFESLSNLQVAKRRQQLSKTLFCMADACAEIGRFDEAIKYYSEAIQHSRLRAASMDDRRFYQICKMQEAAHCASCFTGIANVYMKKEKYPEALKMFNDAIRYCEKQGKKFVVFERSTLVITSASLMFFTQTLYRRPGKL